MLVIVMLFKIIARCIIVQENAAIDELVFEVHECINTIHIQIHAVG